MSLNKEPREYFLTLTKYKNQYIWTNGSAILNQICQVSLSFDVNIAFWDLESLSVPLQCKLEGLYSHAHVQHQGSTAHVVNCRKYEFGGGVTQVKIPIIRTILQYKGICYIYRNHLETFWYMMHDSKWFA